MATISKTTHKMAVIIAKAKIKRNKQLRTIDRAIELWGKDDDLVKAHREKLKVIENDNHANIKFYAELHGYDDNDFVAFVNSKFYQLIQSYYIKELDAE